MIRASNGLRPPVSIALNDAVREYGQPSARYRDVFNRTAEEEGFAFRWVSDGVHPNAIDPGELRLGGSTPTSFAPELQKDLKRVLQRVEQHRLEAVKTSATYNRHIPFRAPLELLNPVERKAVDLLEAEVKPLINRIEARQHDPAADEQSRWMARHADYYSGQIFARVHHDSGVAPPSADPFCSLLPFFPDKPPINGMIDKTITMEELTALTATQPAGSELLRPSTMLKRSADGSVQASPLALDPAFKHDHQLLARALDKVANLSLDGEKLSPELRTQLTAWAQFFRTGSAEDERKAAQATIDAGESSALLRVHVGPTESYWADNMKFPYSLQVAVRDPEFMTRLKPWGQSFPQLEQSLADIPHYTPRPVSTRGGFCDAFSQAVTGGFVETFEQREIRGNNFPNYNYGTEGSNRFAPLESTVPVVEFKRTIGQRLLADPLPPADHDLWNEILLTAGHESGHLLGPQRDHVTPSGQLMGVVFGEHWGSADEPKADLTALAMLREARLSGKITQAQEEEHFQAFLMYMLMLYPSRKEFEEGTLVNHRFGFVLQTGYYLQEKALSFEDGKFQVDYPKLEQCSHDLWKKIITYQAAGDKEGFLAFSRQCASAIPDSVDSAIRQAQQGWQEYFVERYR